MTVVDAHTHVWGLDTESYPWQSAVLPPGWEGAYTDADLLADMDAAGVDEAVLVSTPLYGRGPEANAYVEAAIRRHPDRFYGVGLMEFFRQDPGDAANSLKSIASSERMLGVRVHAALEYDDTPREVNRNEDWFKDDRLHPVFEACADEGIAIFVFPKVQQLTDVEELIEAFPAVQFVIDHMAWPDETTAPDKALWTDFHSIAEHDNVAVKVSSLPRSSEQAWPYSDLWGYVRNLVNWFGVERLMLGSDYPWMDDWATYEECLSWLDETDFLSRRDRRYLRGQSFVSLHG